MLAQSILGSATRTTIERELKVMKSIRRQVIVSTAIGCALLLWDQSAFGGCPGEKTYKVEVSGKAKEFPYPDPVAKGVCQTLAVSDCQSNFNSASITDVATFQSLCVEHCHSGGCNPRAFLNLDVSCSNDSESLYVDPSTGDLGWLCIAKGSVNRLCTCE